MSTFTGFSELRTPKDLLRKLQHDISRMDDNPGDEYAAFDFFVTAEHIVDWLHPSDKKAREELRSSQILLRITSHIANGAKHFEATAKHHASVGGIQKGQFFDSDSSAPEELKALIVVTLAEDEAIEAHGSSIEVVTLAARVLQYWERRLINEA